MQVLKHQEFTSHAAVGAGKVVAAQIAQTAEFYRVLSDTLYSDKPRAVVREILCNAWDAHIAAGVTNIPIQITLTDEFFIVRDFGSGIPDDKMGEVYLTYGGGSTKTHDGKQTGGFALGSKAPWAHAEHFEVQSFNNGTHTIYNLSRESVAADGFPACQTIVAMPTSETGLQVSVPLKDRDSATFRMLIETIVKHGAMNVTLNGNQLDTLPFDEAKDGFVLTSDAGLSAGLYVRYGAVVYPVPWKGEYILELDRAKAFCSNPWTEVNWGGRALILQAAPNTIAVTPSRETLSMTEETTAVIKELLTKFIEKVQSAEVDARVAAIKGGTSLCWSQHSGFGQLFDSRVAVPNFLKVDHHDHWAARSETTTVKARDVATHYYFYSLKQDTDLLKKSQLARMKIVAASGYDTTHLARSYASYAPRVQSARAISKARSMKHWFDRKILLPIWRQMQKPEYPLVKFNRLGVFKYHYQGPIVRNARKASAEFIGGKYLEFTAGLIVLTYNQTDLGDRLNKFPAIRHRYGQLTRAMVYTVPRSQPEHAEQARQLFTKMGYRILDLTVRHAWEPKNVVATKERAPARPRTSGYLTVSAFVRGLESLSKDKEVTDILADPDADRLPKPDIIMKVTPGLAWDWASYGYQPNLDRTVSKLFVAEFGDRCGIAQSQAQYDKAIENGALPYEVALKQWATQKLAKNRAYKRHRSHQDLLSSIDFVKLYDSAQHAIRAVFEDETLRQFFGLHQELDDETKLAEQVVKAIYPRFPDLYASAEELRKEIIGNVGLSKAAQRLLDQVKSKDFPDTLGWSMILHCFRDSRREYLPRLRKTVITAIKG